MRWLVAWGRAFVFLQGIFEHAAFSSGQQRKRRMRAAGEELGKVCGACGRKGEREWHIERLLGGFGLTRGEVEAVEDLDFMALGLVSLFVCLT
jgi:hypothetical protein